MTFYNRKVLGELRKWVDKPVILVVTGMRQVGKTTILRMLFDEINSSNKVFLDLENPLIQQVFRERDFDNIWGNLKRYGIVSDVKAYVFLDELQLMPESVKAIKYLFDHYDVQFFVTGSSSFYLKNLFPESLAGRKVVFELFPLDFEEFLWFKGVKKDFQSKFIDKDADKSIVSYERSIKFYGEYLRWGGFPKVVLAMGDDEKKALIEDVYKSYFEVEVRSLAEFRDIHKLHDCIRLLMQRVGSRLNVNRLSQELEVSRPTVYSYLSFLQATYFLSLVSPYSRSVDKEISVSKKVYLCDTGILNQLAQVSSGSVLENAVHNAIRGFHDVRYYQSRRGVEIDFILAKEGIALEVKERGNEQDRNHLSRLVKELKLKESYVISKEYVGLEGFICATDV